MATLKDSGIYCIKHVATGKRYVGSAVNLERRFKRHLTELRKGIHHSSKLQEAWNEFGGAAFEISVLVRCQVDWLLELEQKAIDVFDAVNSGYNVASFADAPYKGKKHSEATRKKMRQAHKARKPISQETRERLSQAAKERERMKKETGYQVSEETRAKLTEKLTGRPVSEETRDKMSQRLKGRKLTEEHCSKLSEAHKGYAPTDEHRKNLSEAGKRRWAKTRGEEV